MKKNRLLLFMIFLCSWVAQTHAQERIVSGTVTSAQDHSPIPGVSVVIVGTAQGAMTDANGFYSLSVPPSGTRLSFSFVGMKTLDIEIGTRSRVDVQMQPDVLQLNEVVVTETGYSQEKKFIGSSGVISGESIQRTAMASLDQNMQGRIAGVLVNSGSGQPGASGTVRIRGVSSISGASAQPLYVIDGVPVLGDLSSINANDIVSLTVLKDGASGALYGARGANGVIVITTRRGQSGVAALEFRTQVGVSVQPKPTNFSMMNTAQALKYEEDLGLLGFAIQGPGWAYSKQNPTYAAQTELEKKRRDDLLNDFRDNALDYEKLLFRNGISTTNELVARGGGEKTKYYASFNVFNQQGFAAGSNFKRYTGRVNIDHQFKKVTLALTSTITSSETNRNVGDWVGNSPGNPFQIVWRAKPYEPVYRNDGQLDFGAHTALVPRTIANAIERSENSVFRARNLRILGSLALKYDITKSLSIRNNVGVDLITGQGMYSIRPNSYVGSIQVQNSGYHTEGILNNYQVINTSSVNYSALLNDDHELEAGVYFETIRVKNNGFGYQLFNLDKRLSETGQGAGNIPTTAGQTNYPQNGSGAKSQYGIRSYFATTRYTYRDKYTANFNVRVDGTSRISNDKNKEIFTWSAGLGWDAINEKFMQSQHVITDLKLRASFGEVPNIGSIAGDLYVFPGGFFGVPNYLGPQLPTFGTSASFAGSSIPGLIPTAPGNPNLEIERVRKFNIGFDVALLKRISLVVDFYKNTTIDLFVNQPMGATTGFGNSSLPINAGQMSNKGVEMTLNGDILSTDTWLVQANWNHAVNINRIDDLGSVDEYQTGTFLIKEGLPYGSHYTLDYLGADPATGQPIYRKKDGTTTFSQTDAGQVAKFGTYLPKHVGGFGLSAKWRKLQLATLFTYQFDVVRSNNVWSWVTRGIPGYINAVNQSTDLIDRQWRKPGDNKFYQSPQYDRGFTSSDLMDAKFLRFREITVSYILPKLSFATEVKIYARAQNLAIWSPWKGLDPEDDNNISLFEYPNPRMFTFGVDFSF